MGAVDIDLPITTRLGGRQVQQNPDNFRVRLLTVNGMRASKHAEESGSTADDDDTNPKPTHCCTCYPLSQVTVGHFPSAASTASECARDFFSKAPWHQCAHSGRVTTSFPTTFGAHHGGGGAPLAARRRRARDHFSGWLRSRGLPGQTNRDQ